MRFYAGRISLLPIENLFAGLGRANRTQALEQVLSRPFEFTGKYSTHLVHEPLLSSNRELLGGVLGRASKERLPQREAGHFIKRQAELWPHVYYLYARSENLVLVQYDSRVFQDPHKLLENLALYLSTQLFQTGLTAIIVPLTVRGRFWATLADLTSVNEVHLRLVAPNFLGDWMKDTKKMLEGVVAETQAEEIEHSLYSNSGKIRIPKNAGYESAVEWIEAGGGKWSIVSWDGGRSIQKSGRSLRYVRTKVELSGLTPEQIVQLTKSLAESMRLDVDQEAPKP